VGVVCTCKGRSRHTLPALRVSRQTYQSLQVACYAKMHSREGMREMAEHYNPG